VLGRELRALIDAGVLSAEQAARLWQAAQKDRGPEGELVRAPAEQSHAIEGRDTVSASSTGVLDVLGYVGGALLLGALIFVGSPCGVISAEVRRRHWPSHRVWCRSRAG
jgi:hypothetical protein